MKNILKVIVFGLILGNALHAQITLKNNLNVPVRTMVKTPNPFVKGWHPWNTNNDPFVFFPMNHIEPNALGTIMGDLQVMTLQAEGFMDASLTNLQDGATYTITASGWQMILVKE